MVTVAFQVGGTASLSAHGFKGIIVRKIIDPSIIGICMWPKIKGKVGNTKSISISVQLNQPP